MHPLIKVTLLYTVLAFPLVLCFTDMDIVELSDIESNTNTLQPLSPRLVAIGDVHGDITNFKNILQLAGIVNSDGNWIGGDAIVVQMGDVADRGPHSHTIYEYIVSVLKPQAKAEGGEFIHLLGNHELLNLKGDHRFTHPLLIKQFGGLNKWLYQFSPDGIYGQYIASLPVIVVRMGTVFVHAGLLQEHAFMGVDRINSYMKEVIHKRSWDDPFLSLTSPVWTRDTIYSAMKEQDTAHYSDTPVCKVITDVLSILTLTERHLKKQHNKTHPISETPPIHRMIIGHTIQPNGRIAVFCNSTYIATDISISGYLVRGHHGYVEFMRKNRIYGRRMSPQNGSVTDYDPKTTKMYHLSIREATIHQLETESVINGLEVIPTPFYPVVEPQQHNRQSPMSNTVGNGEEGIISKNTYDVPVKAPDFNIMIKYGFINDNHMMLDSVGFEHSLFQHPEYLLLLLFMPCMCLIVAVMGSARRMRYINYFRRRRKSKTPEYYL